MPSPQSPSKPPKMNLYLELVCTHTLTYHPFTLSHCHFFFIIVLIFFRVYLCLLRYIHLWQLSQGPHVTSHDPPSRQLQQLLDNSLQAQTYLPNGDPSHHTPLVFLLPVPGFSLAPRCLLYPSTRTANGSWEQVIECFSLPVFKWTSLAGLL